MIDPYPGNPIELFRIGIGILPENSRNYFRTVKYFCIEFFLEIIILETGSKIDNMIGSGDYTLIN